MKRYQEGQPGIGARKRGDQVEKVGWVEDGRVGIGEERQAGLLGRIPERQPPRRQGARHALPQRPVEVEHVALEEGLGPEEGRGEEREAREREDEERDEPSSTARGPSLLFPSTLGCRA